MHGRMSMGQLRGTDPQRLRHGNISATKTAAVEIGLLFKRGLTSEHAIAVRISTEALDDSTVMDGPVVVAINTNTFPVRPSPPLHVNP